MQMGPRRTVREPCMWHRQALSFRLLLRGSKKWGHLQYSQELKNKHLGPGKNWAWTNFRVLCVQITYVLIHMSETIIEKQTVFQGPHKLLFPPLKFPQSLWLEITFQLLNSKVLCTCLMVLVSTPYYTCQGACLILLWDCNFIEVFLFYLSASAL